MFGQLPTISQGIRERRSIRRYLPKQIPTDVLIHLLETARWAPSAHNRQPWRFVIIEQGKNRERLAEAMGARLRQDLTKDGVPKEQIDADCARSQQRIVNSPALILLCLTMEEMDRYPDKNRSEAEFLMAVQSVAMAGQNILLIAHELGLSSCWLCAPLFCPQTVRESLEIPETWLAQGLITLGYAEDDREKTRRPLQDSLIWR